VVQGHRWVHLLGFGCAVLLGGEIAARVNDSIRHGVPLLASPTREGDLVLVESWGRRGRPFGHFRKWQLDSFGFRLIPPGPQAGSDSPRLLLLGASETFGLYESPGNEYPAQLARLLQKKQPCQVINASMAGMSLESMLSYWDQWAGRFHAGRVVIYPPTHFYLDVDLKDPSAAAEPSVQQPSRPIFRPRLLDRVNDLYHRLPEWLRTYREECVIRRDTAGRDADWYFSQVPQERVERFEDGLRQLIDHIRKYGVEPVLVTHARSATSPPRPEDATHVRRMRMFYPRATPEVLTAFEDRVNAVIRTVAEQEGLVLIDADRVLSGHRELFADLFHFNDDGAAKMAQLLADQLPPLGPGDALTRQP
jgi:lysophospholipase L1-like esterase